MILVINSGSSSIKFKLFNTQKSQPILVAEGLAERIGIDGALKIEFQNQKYKYQSALENHEVAIELILTELVVLKAIKDAKDIDGVGFRVVHGGKISSSVVIDEEILNQIQDSVKLAPLHNPGALIAIDAVKNILPNVMMVACFDTAFHQTIDEQNYLYAVPYEWYEKHAVRKYGFHGISYQYITQKMSKVLNKPQDQLNLIVCHLGNGASIACIKNGKSFDTSMGLTPLAGLMMGTRSGDIDPSIIEYMTKQLNTDVATITTMLNQESGVKGLSMIGSDMRDISDAYRQNNSQAILALEKYSQTVADFIVKYANSLNGKLDGIVFTAGIGENSVTTKRLIVDKVNLLNLKLDEELNQAKYDDYLLISTPDSHYPVYKVRTDEETMICLDTIRLLDQNQSFDFEVRMDSVEI